MYLRIAGDVEASAAEPTEEDYEQIENGMLEVIRFKQPAGAVGFFERLVVESFEDEPKETEDGVEPEGTISWAVNWEKV